MKKLWIAAGLVVVVSFASLLARFTRAAESDPAKARSGATPWIRSAQALLPVIARAGCKVDELEERYGYLFTLSADEQWLALLSRDADFAKRLVLLHQPTQKAWSCDIAEARPTDYIGQWYPNCFSEDATRLYYGDRSAPIAPEMRELALERGKGVDLERFEGTCLGLHAPVEDSAGKTVAGWYELTQDEGEFGEIAWNAEGTISYRSARKGRVRDEFLLVTPPGDRVGVRYDRVLAHDERERGVLARTLLGAPAGVALSRMAVSPDGAMLAAAATIDLGNGTAGSSYAVVIPLRRGGLEAFPIAMHCNRKIVWGRDSRTLYLYGVVGEIEQGLSGIVRVEIDPDALPARIEPVQLSQAELEAPSLGELAVADLKRRKLAHFAALTKLFETPQTIAEVRAPDMCLTSGHVIELHEAKYFTQPQQEALFAHVARNLTGKPLRMALPTEEEFVRAYIPGGITGQFATPEHRWPMLNGETISRIPVLLFEGDELVTKRFGGEDGPR